MWTHLHHSASPLLKQKSKETRRPWMSGFKATRRGVETIKNISECELHRLEAMVGVPLTLGPRATSTSKPFGLLFLFETRPSIKPFPFIEYVNTITCFFLYIGWK